MTLSQAAIGTDTFTKKILMVLGGSILIALAAQVSVPFFPVPLTMQTMAILVVGLSFGSRMGAATVLAYLAEGAAGLPVFAGGGAGLAYMAGPTAGFLLGFVLMAFVAGLFAERSKNLWTMGLGALIATALLYIPGVAWPMAVANAFGLEAGWVGTSAVKIWAGWVSPFLLGDAVKAAVAALIVSGGWKVLSRK